MMTKDFEYKKCKSLREAGQSPLIDILTINIFLSIAELESLWGLFSSFKAPIED